MPVPPIPRPKPLALQFLLDFLCSAASGAETSNDFHCPLFLWLVHQVHPVICQPLSIGDSPADTLPLRALVRQRHARPLTDLVALQLRQRRDAGRTATSITRPPSTLPT
jgi:hypothetical protein